MTSKQTTQIDLDKLPNLLALYQLLTGGKHLNRLADAGLWAELEREQEAYDALFSGLGYDLRIDGRGFAWIHILEANSNLTKRSRHLALLFLVLFEYQSDAGKPLRLFTDWVIDKTLLSTLHEKYTAPLEAESIDVEGLQKLMKTASDFGFALHENGFWRLLPAVHRYLDHFEQLAQDRPDELSEWLEEQ